MGVGVELEDTYAKTLEGLLSGNQNGKRFEVINAGVAGYNTAQEIDYLQEEGLELDPDLVLLGFFIGNDIKDNYQSSPTVVVNGYLSNSPQPPQGFLPYSIREYFERKSHLYHLLWPYQRQLFDSSYREEIKHAQGNYLSIYAKHEDQETAAMWQVTWKQLSRFAELVKQHSLAAAVVIIPDQIQIDSRKWAQTVDSAGENRADYKRDKPTQKIEEFCSRLNIPAVNLLPVFSETTNRHEAVYLELDGHWTAEGNKLAGEAIYRFLASEQIVENEMASEVTMK
jgi:hypothetical protein